MTKRKTEQKLNFRSAPVALRGDGSPATLDEKSRSVEIVGATEEPVEIYDWERGQIVREVLLMAGAELPGNKQIPLLDSHSRYSTASVIGSFREMRIHNGQLVGRGIFSTAPEAEGPWIKVRESHITDFSVGYRVIESQWVPQNETVTIKNRKFEGPVKVATRWRPKELSAVTIGADELAKARSDTEPETTSAGQPATRTRKELTMPEKDEIRAQERERIANIEVLCRHFNIDPDKQRSMIDNGTSIEEARKFVLDIETSRLPSGIGYRGPIDDGGHPATILKDESEKFRDAASDGLAIRANIPVKQPAPGANHYASDTLLSVAKNCCLKNSIRVHGLSSSQIIERALGTSDLPFIMSNVAGKALLHGHMAYPSVCRQLCRETDTKDFKEQYRNRLSEQELPEEVPEHGDYQYSAVSEEKESFSLTTYGKIFSVTRQAIINDDLGALTATPRAQGASVARLIDQSILSHLVGNAVMGDGIALFDASDHKNFVASGNGAAPGLSTLAASFLAMRTQTALGGSFLNIVPRFILAPAALEYTVMQLLNSTADLTDSKNSGVANPYYKTLEPVIHPYLDNALSTGWYVLASPNEFDTLELSFLQGNRGPVLEQRPGWTVDGIEFKVRVDFAVKSLDWRGMYYNYGA